MESSIVNSLQPSLCPNLKGRDATNASPVSIISAVVQGQESESSPPFVVMSENGAEVTYGETDDMDIIFSNHDASPPKRSKNRYHGTQAGPTERNAWISTLPAHSLMDDVASPSPMTPQKSRSRLPNLWCDNQNLECFKCDEPNEIALTQHVMANTISNFLASPIGPDDWCASWQAWSYYEIDNPVDDPVLDLKNDIKRVLRNRATNVSAKNTHITNLKHDMCPFDTTTPKRKGHPTSRSSIPLSETASFCDGTTDYHRRKNPKHAHSNSVVLSSSLSSLHSCMTSQTPNTMTAANSYMDHSPFVIRSRLDDDLFYDSDPEDCTKQRCIVMDTIPSRTSTCRNQVNKEIMNQREAQNRIEAKQINSSRMKRINLKDDDAVFEQVQQVLNQDFTAVWHPSINQINTALGRDRTTAPPIAIHVWIERGQQFGDTLIQPRLVWRRMYDNNNPGDIGRNLTMERHSMDLLDISRILEIQTMDRNLYPLAKSKNSLLIQSLDDKFVFEVATHAERSRVCRDLKLVVARLGSQVIMDDPRMLDEFFVDG